MKNKATRPILDDRSSHRLMSDEARRPIADPTHAGPKPFRHPRIGP